MALDLRGGHVGLYLGLYEIELNRHLRRLCYPGARSFDIGGQMGYDALVIAKLTQDQVVTVECMPEWAAIIRDNAQANRDLERSITVVTAFVNERTEPDAAYVSIDKLASDFFTPDFMKIDIEGGEVSALRGAQDVLAARRPGLLIEVHGADLEEDCMTLLRSSGYHPHIVDQRRLLRDHRPLAHNRWIVADGAPPPTPEIV